jgi:hypothetical protein
MRLATNLLSEVHMSCKKLLSLMIVMGMMIAIGSVAIADPSKDPKAAGQPEMKLPPGWTAEDMQACIAAGTPGKMHEHLAKNVGVWLGKTTMWMAPDTQPITSECTATYSPFMDGRFIKCEIAGDMPGMGPFNGFGVYGFDNISQKFQATWVDNCSTGIMNGKGDLSSDGRVLTWVFNHHCPITKKPVTMREIETITGPNSKTLEMWGTDPKSGKEYKVMEIAFTRKAGAGGTAGAR